MNAFTVTGEFLLNGADKAQQQINKTSNVAGKASTKMNDAFKKVGQTIASVFAVKKIIDFGASITKASAEVSAEMSALQQIMGDYTDNAVTKLKELEKYSGVASTKMTKYMTSMTAKWKGLGFGIETSMDNAVIGLKMATDASAFWDKSLEDSNSALNSFINGNYEGGQSIGLFANETEIASYAMSKGLVNTTSEFSKLSNQQKQLIRLEFAQKMMEDSGVMGQSAREADQYAVQMGNLTEKWRQFKAQIGEPVLEKLVIPAIRKLNGLIDTLSKKFEELKGWMEENEKTVTMVKDAFELASIAVAGFVLTVASIKIVKGATSALLGLLNPLTLIIVGLGGLVALFIKTWNTNDEFRDKITNAWNTLKANLQPVFDWISGIVSGFMTNLPTYKDAIVGILGNIWTKVQEVWIQLQPVFQWIGDKWTQFTGILQDAYNNIIVPVISGIVSKFTEFKEQISEPIGAIVGAVQSIIDSIFNIGGSMVEVESAGGIVETVLNGVQAVLDGVVWFINNVLAPIITGVASFISEHIEPIKAIFQGVFGTINGLFQTFIAVFKGDWNGAWESLKATWESLKTAVVNAFTLLLDLIKGIIQWDKLKPWLEKQWKNLKDTVVGWINGIGDWFTGVFDTMKNIGKNLIDGLLGGIKGAWDGLKEGVTNVADGVVGWFKDIFGVHSPSTVLEAIGQFLMEGLGIGIEEGSDGVEDAGKGIVDKLLGILKDNSAFQQIAKSLGFDISGWIKEGIEEGAKTDSSDAGKNLVPTPDPVKTMNVFQKIGTKIKTWWTGIKAYTKNADNELEFDFKGTMENIGTALQDAISLYQDTLGTLFSNIQAYQDTIEQNAINTLQKEYDELTKSHDKKLKLYENETKKKKAEYAKQYADGTISYSQYIQKVKELDSGLSDYEQTLKDEEEAKEDELNRKKDELARKQFEANKSTQIAQALANASMAIVQCFAQLGPVAGAIATAVVATATAVEIATIRKQEYVSAYAEGGIIDKPTVGLVGEDGKEAIVPLERNLEWTNSLAKAIAPAIQEERNNPSALELLMEEIRDIRMMLADNLGQLIDKDSRIVVSASGMAVALAPEMDVQLGRLQKKNARR